YTENQHIYQFITQLHYRRYLNIYIHSNMFKKISRQFIASTLINSFVILLFIFNYYVLMFVHTRKIYKYNKNIIFYCIGNFLSLYILILYVQVYYQIIPSKCAYKIRQMGEHTETNLNSIFNPYFTQNILKERTETMKTCEKCGMYRPPRAYHCYICDTCFMKMYHHSYIFNTCIGHTNYKYYYLLLMSNFIYSLFQLILLLYFAINARQTPQRMTFYALAIVSNSIFVVTSLIYLIINTKLLLYNETTTERSAINNFLEGRDDYKDVFQEGVLCFEDEVHVKDRKILNPYFLGYKENIKEVFGDNYYEWIMPYFTGRSDGIYFKKSVINKEQ
ncbi:putative DHHC-type Zn-finger protein, partial [Trachipleistophora hominis]